MPFFGALPRLAVHDRSVLRPRPAVVVTAAQVDGRRRRQEPHFGHLTHLDHLFVRARVWLLNVEIINGVRNSLKTLTYVVEW